MAKSIQMLEKDWKSKKHEKRQIVEYTYFWIHEENNAKEGLDEIVIGLFQRHAHG